MGKADSSGARAYVRDGAGVASTVTWDGSAQYTPGASQRRNGATTYELADRLGTVSRQTSAAAATVATRTYDAFGALTASTGTPKSPFGFAGSHGYQEDADSGLKLLGRRYYDASTGRFLTRDPAKDGRNWYAYCDGNPLKWIDPDGFSKIKISPSQLVNLVQAIADENWDMFFLIVETITGVDVPQPVKDIIANLPRPKKVLKNPAKATGCLLRQIVEHAKKIADDPGSPAVKHWKIEIKNFMESVYKKQK